MSATSRTVQFAHNGQQMPLVGLGTWQSPASEAREAVHWALEAGYRHIDTAIVYQNEAAIGEVLEEWIQSGEIKREELFITTKLPFIGNKAEHVERFLTSSLQRLKLDYVDLYLIHFPVGFTGKNDEDLFPLDKNGKANLDLETDHISVWKAMETQVDAGRCKSIGLSNFNSQQIEKIVASARIKPANLQVELHAYFQQKQLRELCAKHGITVCAYGPLGSKGRVHSSVKRGIPPPPVPEVMEDPVVLEIAKKHGKSPAQILLRHLIQQDIVVIPKSVSEKRIRENIDIFNFALSSEEMGKLNNLDRNIRSFKFDFFPGMKDHPEFPFHIPF